MTRLSGTILSEPYMIATTTKLFEPMYAYYMYMYACMRLVVYVYCTTLFMCSSWKLEAHLHALRELLGKRSEPPQHSYTGNLINVF